MGYINKAKVQICFWGMFAFPRFAIAICELSYKTDQRPARMATRFPAGEVVSHDNGRVGRFFVRLLKNLYLLPHAGVRTLPVACVDGHSQLKASGDDESKPDSAIWNGFLQSFDSSFRDFGSRQI